MRVYQLNGAGLLIGETDAPESPLEPGVFHIPAGCTESPPPAEWTEDKWPRWNGSQWQLVNRPAEQVEPSPLEKLQAFLAANPDVAALVEPPAPV